MNKRITTIFAFLVTVGLASCGGGSDRKETDLAGSEPDTATTGDTTTGPGEDTNVPGDVGGQTMIHLSGTFVSGTQTALKADSGDSLASGLPLADCQIYCVTFATQPAAAAGTADATGRVTLTIDALGVAIANLLD
jgi:hypothetical protein